MSTNPGRQESLMPFLSGIRVSEKTRTRYSSVLRGYMAWSGGSLPASQDEAQAYLDNRGDLSPASLAVAGAAISRYLRWCKIPVSKLERPPVHLPTPKYLSVPQVKALLEACDYPLLQCLIAVLYDTGARINEILTLEVKNIDDKGLLKVRRKGGKEEWTPISDWGLKYLDRWLFLCPDRHYLVFGDQTYQEILRECKRIARKAGIKDFSPHQLRHSRAVHLHEAGLDWADIAYTLGHVNPSTTMKIYARPTAEDLRQRLPAPRI